MAFQKNNKIRLGSKNSEEHRRRISIANKGKTNALMSEYRKTHTMTKEQRQKAVRTRLKNGSYKKTEEQKKVLHFALLGKNKGKKSDRKGLTYSQYYKPEVVQRMLTLKSGKNHWSWNDKRERTYPIIWTNTLKRSIRERDKYVCQLCFEQQTETVFDIHHIDYNKNNCNPDNLVTLCRNCHMKTNCKDKQYWITHFTSTKI